MKEGTGFSPQVSGPPRHFFMVMAALSLGGCFGGAREGSVATAAAGQYAHRLHNRFYEAWRQPASVAAPTGKIFVPVDIEIERSGRVANFRIAQKSGYARVDDSIEAIAREVREVEPPPFALRRDHYHLRINFELDVKE